MLTLAEADAELQRLAVLKKNHLDEQYVARRSVRDLPATIAGLSDRLSKLSADDATAKAHASDPIAIGGRTYPLEDIPDILGGKLDGLPNKVRETARIPLGNYQGLGFGIVLHSQFAPEIYLEGATTRLATLSREHHGPRAVLNALERLAGGYGSECDRVRRDLGIAESQLRDYQARLGKPFLHDTYLAELTTLRDQLKAGLSGAAQEPGKEDGPSVSELTERIKALKAANSDRSHATARPAETFLRRGTHHRPHPPADGSSSRVRSRDRVRCCTGGRRRPHRRDQCRIRPSIRREVSGNASFLSGNARTTDRARLEPEMRNSGMNPTDPRKASQG